MMTTWVRGVRQGLRSDEQGSMLFAMMGVLLVTGLMVSILATVMMGQRSGRYDQRFDASGQSSDAGVQQAFFAINSLTTDSTTTSLSSGGTQSIGDSSYTWTATRPSATSLTWSVSSTAETTSGRCHDNQDSASPRSDRTPSSPLAAFADATITMRGGNTADSYPTCRAGGLWVPTALSA